MFRLRSLRLRIAAAFILGSIVVTGLVGATTYYLISRTLLEGRRETILTQSFLGVGAARNLLQNRAENPDEPPATASEIVTRLQRRGDVIVRHGGEFHSSAHLLDESVVP